MRSYIAFMMILGLASQCMSCGLRLDGSNAPDYAAVTKTNPPGENS